MLNYLFLPKKRHFLILLKELNEGVEIRSIPRGFGSYGDMVLVLNDGSKVEMKSLPLFREKQKFIEENMVKRSQTLNLNEVEGFATKS